MTLFNAGFEKTPRQFGDTPLSRRAFVRLASLTAVSGAAFSLMGCSSDADSSGRASSAPSAPTKAPQAVSRPLSGTTDPVDVRVGLIMGPPSMALSRFLINAQNGDTYNRFSFEICGVDYPSVAARLNQGDFDIVTLPSNLGAVLYNNKDIDVDVACIAINNLGVLYGITSDPSVKKLADLEGRTVYVYGEGGTPEYTIDTVLAGHDMAGKVNLVFKSTPFEILNLLQQEENCIAIIPQPFVELAKYMTSGLATPIDITKEWDSMEGNDGSRAVTTHTVVNCAFLEEHELAVVEYLQQMAASVDWTLDHITEAAACQVELGTFMNDEVALGAMPYCSFVCLTGETAYDALSGFLEAIYAENPESVGGALPGTDFYYLPPLDSLDRSIEDLVSEMRS